MLLLCRWPPAGGIRDRVCGTDFAKGEIMRRLWVISVIFVFHIVFSKTSEFRFSSFDFMTIQLAPDWLLWNHWPRYCWSFIQNIRVALYIDDSSFGGKKLFCQLTANSFWTLFCNVSLSYSFTSAPSETPYVFGFSCASPFPKYASRFNLFNIKIWSICVLWHCWHLLSLLGLSCPNWVGSSKFSLVPPNKYVPRCLTLD